MVSANEYFRLLIAGILFVAAVILAIRTVASHRQAAIEPRLDVLNETVSKTQKELDRLPDTAELVLAWQQVPIPDYPPDLASHLRPVYRLWAADPASTAELFRLARAYVVALNKPLCEAIDNRWVAPAELVRRHPALHKRLVMDLPLIVPYIWVNSIAEAHGQGRFGYRVARLFDILVALRALNPEPHLGLVDRITVQYQGQVFLDAPELGRFALTKTWLRAVLYPYTINTASKVAQENWRHRLSRTMTQYGLAAADLDAVKVDKAW